MLGDFVDEFVGLFAVIGNAEPLANVGESHESQSDGAVFLVRLVRFVHGRASDVDEVIELAYGDACAFVHLDPVDFAGDEVRREVDRCQVTDRHVFGVLREADFGAEVRRVDRAGVVVEGAKVDRVFPRQPRVG